MPALATEFVVSLTTSDHPGTRRRLEDYAVWICEQARKHGYKAAAAWRDDKLQLRFQDAAAEEMREFLDPLIGNAKENGAISSIFEEHEPAVPVAHLDDAPFPWGSVLHARLTRDLLTSLPEGAYVATISEDDRAASLGRVGPFHVRAQQWQRAQLAGLEGGMCRVFWSEREYDAFLNAPNENMR